MDSSEDVQNYVHADVANFPLERIGSTGNSSLPSGKTSVVSSPKNEKTYPVGRATQFPPPPHSSNSIFDIGVQMLETTSFQEIGQSSSDLSSYMSSLEEAMGQPQGENYNSRNRFSRYKMYGSETYNNVPYSTQYVSSKVGGDMEGNLSFNNSVDESSLTTFLEEFRPMTGREFNDFETQTSSDNRNNACEKQEKTENKNNLKRSFESQDCQKQIKKMGFTILTELSVNSARPIVKNSIFSPRRVFEGEEEGEERAELCQREIKKRVLEDNYLGEFENGCNGGLNIERKSVKKSEWQPTTKWRTVGGSLYENRVVMSSQSQNSLESQLERLAEDWKEATTVGCLTMASIPYSLLRTGTYPSKKNRFGFL